MKFCLALLLCVLLLVGAALSYAASQYQSAGPLMQAASVIIPKGTGLVASADLLQTNHVISNKYIFIAAAKLQGGTGLKAGEYEFAPSQPMDQVLTKIINGNVVHRKFTIPEGRTSYEVVGIISKVDKLTGDVKVLPQEGSILPETYEFQTGDTRQKKIDEMKLAMDKMLTDLWKARVPDPLIKTPQDAVILASIVEKETGKASERKIIAGVFLNRLRIGMPLQSDPTVIYALTMGHIQNDGQGPLGRRLLRDDLASPSPYNTYLNTGLPPGPIANPGRDALEAVLHPDQNDFLYFVADGTGGHVFAKTLEEHNHNVAQWRKIRE